MSLILSVNPTLYLRGIVPSEELEKLRSGSYSTLSRASLTTTKSSTVGANLVLQTDQSSDRYVYRDSNGNLQSVCSVGTQPAGQACQACRRPLPPHPLGIPVSIRLFDGVYQYSVIGQVCDFRCALRETRRQTRMVHRYRSPLYLDSEVLLFQLFESIYPGQILKESHDPNLLAPIGPLNSEQYDQPNLTYFPTPTTSIAFVRYPVLELSSKEFGVK